MMQIEVHGKYWDRVYIVVSGPMGLSVRSEYLTTYEKRQKMAEQLQAAAREVFPEGFKDADNS